MEPWFEELLRVWGDSVEELATELLAAYERDPSQKGKWDLNTLRQIMHGGVAMMPAEYGGQGTEFRQGYLESVLPGMLEAGSSLPVTCASTIAMAMRTYPMLLERLSPEYREKAGDFLCRAYAKYMFDLVRVGIDIMNGKVS